MKNWILAFVGCDGTGKSTQIRMLTEWLKGEGYLAKSSREPGGSRRGEVIRSILMDRKKGFSPEQHNIVNLDLVRMAETISLSGSRFDSVAEHVLTLSQRKTMSDDFEIVLFVLARLIHYQEEIRPYMEEETSEDVFILDRFWPCTYAYQICARLKDCKDEEIARFMNSFFEWHVGYLIGLGVMPEFVLLDTDPSIGHARINVRPGEQTDFDKLARTFHEFVREGYRSWQNQCDVSHPDVRFRAAAHLIDATPAANVVFEHVKRIMQLRMNGTSSSDAQACVA